MKGRLEFRDGWVKFGFAGCDDFGAQVFDVIF
jgi:hypothetical protein